MSTKTILMTGASGFIGFHIRTFLHAAGYSLITITRSDLVLLSSNNEKVIKGDFYDSDFLNTLDIPIDCIIHCAAIRGESDLPESEYTKVNLGGTKALLDFSLERKIPHFIYLSSVGVLGTIPYPQPASNQNLPNPDGKYHRSKWQAEELVRRYHSANLKTIILRPTITYGSDDNGFIPTMINMVRKGMMAIPRNDVYIHLLSINSITVVINGILKKNIFNGQAYILADKKPVPLRDIVQLIAEKVNNKCFPKYLFWPNFIFKSVKKILSLVKMQKLLTSIQLISENWTYDISDTVNNLGFEPRDTLAEIKKMYE